MHPRLVRTVFRSLLRASERGQHPQVFGSYGAAVFASQVDDSSAQSSLALPTNARQVRERLKRWFRHGDHRSRKVGSPVESVHRWHHDVSLFEMLRNVNARSEVFLAPLTEVKGGILPIFEYDGIVPLPGECIRTIFLEPRYRELLLQYVLGSKSQNFLIRACETGSSATLLKLIDYQDVQPLVSNVMQKGFETSGPHSEQNSTKRINGVAVTAVAGPSVQILKTTKVTLQPNMEKSENSFDKCLSKSMEPLSLATQYDYRNDFSEKQCESLTDQAQVELRQYILDMLRCALGIHGLRMAETLVKTEFGLPPLEIDAFSCWAIRFLLQSNDLDMRQRWLHECSSTMERLNFIVEELESILEATSDEVDQSSLG